MSNKTELNKSGIYRIVNLVNGKFYIGSTNCFRIRFKFHRNRLRNNKHFNYLLQRSWNKYGEENFLFEIIEFVDDIDSLHIREQFWLDETESYKIAYGFNILEKAGKPNKIIFTDEIRSKMRAKKLGIPRTEEEKLKLSKAMQGRRLSCKLTEEDVVNIKLLFRETDLNKTEIANLFNVNLSTISYILNNKTWQEISPQPDDYLSEELLIRLVEIKSNRKPIKNNKKLNEGQVKIIKLMLRDTTLFQFEIAKLFNVVRQTITDINMNKKWSDVRITPNDELDLMYQNIVKEIIERR